MWAHMQESAHGAVLVSGPLLARVFNSASYERPLFQSVFKRTLQRPLVRVVHSTRGWFNSHCYCLHRVGEDSFLKIGS